MSGQYDLIIIKKTLFSHLKKMGNYPTSHLPQPRNISWFYEHILFQHWILLNILIRSISLQLLQSSKILSFQYPWPVAIVLWMTTTLLTATLLPDSSLACAFGGGRWTSQTVIREHTLYSWFYAQNKNAVLLRSGS